MRFLFIFVLFVGANFYVFATWDDKIADVDKTIVKSWTEQYEKLQYELENAASTRALYKTGSCLTNPHLLDVNSMIWESDKDPLDVILRRTRALLDDLKRRPGANTTLFAEYESRFNELSRRAGLAKSSKSQRTEMFYEAAALRRQIALSNPLLNNIDELIFTVQGNKYHNTTEFIRHIIQCDDYGFTATPCGGIYVVSNFKSGTPKVRDLLETATVKNGRYKGQKLAGRGAFNSLDISYDKKHVAFAWVEKPSPVRPDCHGTMANFTPQTCFHIFRYDIDTDEIYQLTDGPDNDHHPCWTPDGRIVFCSERRKSVVRCDSYKACSPEGAHQPCATLFSMKPDGSDLYPISYHETTEIMPSIDNQGMLVYTRWDYIDRAFHVAHHLWISTPDGCDPRAPHGNYPYPHSTIPGIPQSPVGRYNDPKKGWLDYDGRASRPWAEYGIRAVPGTASKYIATAGWHHGPHGGEPILIDISIRDDNMMSQVKTYRATCCLPHEAYVIADNIGNLPKVAPAGCQTDYFKNNVCQFMYSPWPLSEEYFLAGVGGGMQGGSPNNLPPRLYLVDKFGTEELIVEPEVKWYGTKGISDAPKVMYIMPFKSREKPPVVARRTFQGERKNSPGHYRATIAIQNIYESDFEWPPNTKIKQLRIIQLLSRPQGAGVLNIPPMGYGEGAQSRMVLGVVPVDEDGSVYCEAPVGKLIMFQALDEKGMAVQSMRSGTYVHNGEQLMCIGCHEDKWKTPNMSKIPTAWLDKPDTLQPDVGNGWPNDACPITFARLMGKTISSKCQPCHNNQKVNIDLSYAGLKDWAFYFEGFEGFNAPVRGGSRTTAGRFGARESRLGKKLLENHYPSKISYEEFHRVTTWLDCNSMELAAHGGYNYSGDGKYRSPEDVQRRQRAGELLWPEIDVDPANLPGVEKDRPAPGAAVTAIQRLREKAGGAYSFRTDIGLGPYIFIQGNTIIILNTTSETISAYVYDCAGRVVAPLVRKSKEAQFSFSINELRLSSGMYVVKVISPNRINSKLITRTR